MSGIWTHHHWIPFRRSNRPNYQAMSPTRTESQLCTATPISSLCSVFTFHFGYCLRQSPHLLEAKPRTSNHVSSRMIHTYGIHHWRIFTSSDRKLARVWFEPTITEFRSDALTDWAIRPWIQLALRANFVQLLQFHLFVQCSRFISAIAFVSHHICLKRNLAQVITLAAEWLIHVVFTNEGLLEVALEIWPEWDLN